MLVTDRVRCRAVTRSDDELGQGSEMHIESCRSGRVTEICALPRVPSCNGEVEWARGYRAPEVVPSVLLGKGC
jgi:hypothetical protein